MRLVFTIFKLQRSVQPEADGAQIMHRFAIHPGFTREHDTLPRSRTAKPESPN